MGTRLGYVVRGNNDDPSLPPAMMLFSNEVSNDAEAIFRDIASQSMGPTDFMQKLSAINVKKENGKDLPIFYVESYHDDTERVLQVHWEYTPELGNRPVVVTLSAQR